MDKKTQTICIVIGGMISYMFVQSISKKQQEEQAKADRDLILRSTRNLYKNAMNEEVQRRMYKPKNYPEQ